MIVNEPWWSPPAKFADIVLPATTTLERNDIQATDLSRFYFAMYKVIEPVAKSRNDFDIFAELSSRLGFGEAYTEGRDEMGWLEHMYAGASESAAKRGFQLPSFDSFGVMGILNFQNPNRTNRFSALFETIRTLTALRRHRAGSRSILKLSRSSPTMTAVDTLCGLSQPNGWEVGMYAHFRYI